MERLDPGERALLSPRRFRLEEYHRLIEKGVLTEGDRVELLEGVIAEMTPQGRPHARFISELNERLVSALPRESRVRVQLPLSLDEENEPEPDLAVVTRAEEDAAPAHPRSATLVIEVASDSLRKDRLIKGRIYARAGIPEYWLANVLTGAVEVYTDPLAQEGRYGSLHTVGRGETLTPRAFPGIAIPVDALFR